MTTTVRRTVTVGLPLKGSLSLEAANRGCKLSNYKSFGRIKPFYSTGKFVFYSSPDSTYSVTKELIDSAKKSIQIGIYDLTAKYIRDLILRAMRRGVKTSLLLDLDNRSGETPIFNELKNKGCESVPAPSCASSKAHFFPSYHEKVIVLDGKTTMVQSGNLTPNSVPENLEDGTQSGKFALGNRDMGVAITDTEISAFFVKQLKHDTKLELDASKGNVLMGPFALETMRLLYEEAPVEPPPKLFPSMAFSPSSPVKVTPVLSPENYMDIVPKWILGARRSIWMEQQYIKATQPAVRTLLSAIRTAMSRNIEIDVRIILAVGYDGGKEASVEIDTISKSFGLKMGKNIRLLNPRYFVHCHNKSICIDSESILIGSQNWSHSAVTTNREAGLLIEYPELAEHVGEIIRADWDTGLTEVKIDQRPRPLSPGRSVAEVSWGDYAEV